MTEPEYTERAKQLDFRPGLQQGGIYLNKYGQEFTPGRQSNGHYLHKNGRKDLLVALAVAGTNMAKAPLLIDNNWARGMTKDFSAIHSQGSHRDLSKDCAELRKLLKQHQKGLPGKV